MSQVTCMGTIKETFTSQSLTRQLTSLSPVKAGGNARNHFGYQDSSCWLQELSAIFERKATDKLVDGEVKQALSGDGYEILLKRHTEIKESLNFEIFYYAKNYCRSQKSHGSCRSVKGEFCK